MANRIKDFSTLATLPAPDDFELLDGAANGTRKISALHRANLRNALAPAGGLAFDGRNGGRATVALGSQGALARDDFTVAGVVQLPAANSSRRSLWDLSNTIGVEGAFQVFLENNNTLGVITYADGGGGQLQAFSSGSTFASFLGKTVVLAVVRRGADLFLFVNGAPLPLTTATYTGGGAAPVDWSGNMNSAYLQIGDNNGSRPGLGRMHATTLYNLALSAADVLEIFELGGAVPERFKWGSQVLLNTSPWVRTIGSGGTFSSADATGFTLVPTDYSRVEARALLSGTVSYGSQFRLSGSYSSDVFHSGRYFRVERSGIAEMSGHFTPASNGAFATTFTCTAQLTGGVYQLFLEHQDAGGPTQLSLAKIQRLGALLHLPLDDGLGYQLQDASSNRLHGLISPAGGVSHISPRVRPARVRAVTGSSGATQLGGQAVLPAGYQILAIRARARTGAPSVTVGWSSGAADIAASTGLTSGAWKTLTLTAAGAAPVTGSTDSLWISSGTSDVIEWDATWVPVTP